MFRVYAKATKLHNTYENIIKDIRASEKKEAKEKFDEIMSNSAINKYSIYNIIKIK